MSKPTAEQLKSRLEALIDDGLTLGPTLNVFAERQSPIEKRYAAYAQDHLGIDGDLEFDSNCLASIGSDPGAYVFGWKWVDAEEIFLCRVCRENDTGDGEGEDGMCGDCADRASDE